MKKIIFLLLFLQGGVMMAQQETFVTPNGKKVTININPLTKADNGLTATSENVQLGGALLKPSVLTTTSAYTLAIKGLQAGAIADNVLVADANGVLKWISRSSFTGDNLGNHIATQDLAMSAKNITGAGNISATGKTSTSTAQITSGAGAGKVAVSDASGNITWTDPVTIAGKGDNLGNHTATQDLAMNAKNITGAGNISATGKTSTSTAQITSGAGAGKVAVSDASGNVTWTDPVTIAAKGDNLGNHTATTSLNMNSNVINFNNANASKIQLLGSNTAARLEMGGYNTLMNVTGVSGSAAGEMSWSNYSGTGNTQKEIMRLNSSSNLGIGTTAPTNQLHVFATADPLRLQGLQNGAIANTLLSADANGVVTKVPVGTSGQALTTDATGKMAWSTFSGDNLGNHTANQDLAMSGKNINNVNNLQVNGTSTLSGKVYAKTTNIAPATGSSQLMVDNATGEVYKVGSSTSTSAKPFTSFKYVFKNVKGDWLNYYATGIPSSTYTLIIVGYSFDKIIKMDNGSTDVPPLVMKAYVGEGFQWVLSADYLYATTSDKTAGTWTINCIVINNSLVKQLSDVNVDMGNSENGGGQMPSGL